MEIIVCDLFSRLSSIVIITMLLAAVQYSLSML